MDCFKSDWHKFRLPHPKEKLRALEKQKRAVKRIVETGLKIIGDFNLSFDLQLASGFQPTEISL